MSDTENKDKKIKNKKKGRLSILVCLLVVAIIIGCVVSGIDFIKSNPVRRNVCMSLEFTYDGAAQNRFPNGESFTIDGVKKDEVILAALTELGKQDTYNVDSLKRSISISGSFPSDVIQRISEYQSLYDYEGFRDVKEYNFYPTVYTITLYDDFDPKLSGIDLTDILTAIVKKYKEYFLRTYVYNYESYEENSILSLEEADYRHQINLISGRLQILKEYAEKLYRRHPNFNYQGMNFHDFYLKCYDIEKNGLNNLEAIVMMKAYSKDPERLRDLYKYRIKLLQNELKNKKINLEAIEQLIDSYEMDDILYVGMGGDAYIKVDSNSEGTYETLTSRKVSLNDSITSTNEEISRNNEYLLDLNKFMSQTDIDSVTEQIAGFNTRLEELDKTLSDMIKAYDEFLVDSDELRESGVYYTTPSLFSVSYCKRAIKFTAPICMIAVMLFCIINVFREKKNQRA